jgi:circadian clock protein KaiC
MTASQVRKVPTGVPGFDLLSAGGIPEGRSTLVSGRSGTGKTILGLQIASNLARNGVKTIVLAVEESPDDLITCGDALGFDLLGLVKKGSLRISDATRPMEGPTMVSGEYDMSGLLHRVEALVHETGARAVILDSATALFSPRPPQDLLRSLFFQVVYGFRKLDLTALILAEASGDNDSTTALGVEDYVCDMVVIFRNVIDGERRRRTIEINKYRRSAHYKGEYPCTITGNGLAIFPLDVKERPGEVPHERYSSGFPALDAMIGGGLLRDSIVIVRGPTGSGKTLLAGLYARAGALRGERVSYWGFEEPRPVLLRNFASIGMPMEELDKNGALKVTCRYPEAMGFEDLMVQLRQRLEDFDPSLIVLDSISSIEHSLSEKGFRQFMIGLASLLREHRRSALLTQTVVAGQASEHTAPYLSTIADGILTLDYTTEGYELNRTLRVLKMRGSSHDTFPHRLWIGQGGLKVESEPLRAPPALSRAPLPAQPRLLQGIRALLVEDFTDARETVKAMLESHGGQVVAVSTAQEALHALDGLVPDVLIADIGLPELDGYALMKKVRTLSPDHAKVPAIALTAWTLPEDRARAAEAGFQLHLGKPVEPEKLAAAIAGLVGRK